METFTAKLSQQEFQKLKIFTSSEKLKIAIPRLLRQAWQAKEQLQIMKPEEP